MKLFATALLSSLLSVSAAAQTPAVPPNGTAHSSSHHSKEMANKDMAEAEIRKFDKDSKKITLKHGPIKNLDMPGMTMVFQVKDTGLLDKLALLAVGDKIVFTAEQQQGAYVVTGAEKAVAK